MPLIIFFGLEDPTTINVTEKLIPSPAYSVFVRHYSLLYPHGRRAGPLPEHLFDDTDS
jgi:hypothetical protein